MNEQTKKENTAQQNLLCPNYYGKPGAELFGVVNSSGFIDYLKSTIEVNETFMEEANKGRHPEKRFRFAGNCAKSGCNHWSGKKHACGLIDQVIDVIGNEEQSELPECPIRKKCRWFQQRGDLACAQCNELIRNLETKALHIS